jgi:hypothetical protein
MRGSTTFPVWLFVSFHGYIFRVSLCAVDADLFLAEMLGWHHDFRFHESSYKKTASLEPHDYLRVQIEHKSQDLLSVLFIFVAACKLCA